MFTTIPQIIKNNKAFLPYIKNYMYTPLRFINTENLFFVKPKELIKSNDLIGLKNTMKTSYIFNNKKEYISELNSLLLCAYKYENIEIIKYLKNNGASLENNMYLLFDTICNSDKEEIYEEFFKECKILETDNVYIMSIISKCVKANNIKFIKYFYDKKPGVRISTACLFDIVKNNNLEMLQITTKNISCLCDLKKRVSYGDTIYRCKKLGEEKYSRHEKIEYIRLIEYAIIYDNMEIFLFLFQRDKYCIEKLICFAKKNNKTKYLDYLVLFNKEIYIKIN